MKETRIKLTTSYRTCCGTYYLAQIQCSTMHLPQQQCQLLDIVITAASISMISFIIKKALNQSINQSTFVKRHKSRARCKHCALAVVRQSEKFSPRRRHPSQGRGMAKFNQLEMVTTFTYKAYSLVRIDARNFELSW